MKKEKRMTFAKKIFSIVIILIPFLYQYASPLPILSLGDFCLTLVTFYSLLVLVRYDKVKIYRPILIIDIIIILINMISIFGSPFFVLYDFFTIFLKIILYTLALSVAYRLFDLKYILSIYNKLVFIFATYLWIQYIYAKITNNYLPNYLNYNWLFSWEKRPEIANYYNYRPSSLFLEPGYYALFVLPCLGINLLKENKILFSIFITSSIILSASGAAIAFGVFFWGMYVLSKFVKIGKKTLYISFNKYFAASIIFALLLLFLVINTGLFQRVLGGSFNARISRGFILFNTLSDFNKVFGVGLNNISNYMTYYSINTAFDEINLNSGSTFSTYLVQFGILGYISLIGLCIYILKKYTKDYLTLSFILLFIIYMIFEDVFFNYRMIFLVSFIFYFYNHSAEKRSNKLLLYEARS